MKKIKYYDSSGWIYLDSRHTEAIRAGFSTGSNNQYTLETSGKFNIDENNLAIVFTPNFTNTGAATISVDGSLPKQIQYYDRSTDGYLNLLGGEIIKFSPVIILWNKISDVFVVSRTQVNTWDEL